MKIIFISQNHFFFYFVKKENQIISQNHLTQKSENHNITKSSLKEMLDDFISTNQWFCDFVTSNHENHLIDDIMISNHMNSELFINRYSQWWIIGSSWFTKWTFLCQMTNFRLNFFPSDTYTTLNGGLTPSLTK